MKNACFFPFFYTFGNKNEKMGKMLLYFKYYVYICKLKRLTRDQLIQI